ncbi:MAG: IS110 family transposase [Acidobacteriia bacterium]|nr:IS110 family transposase [Terriglobia bacterium]
MRFYTQQHTYYCGIDLHARTMYVCIVDGEGEVVVHKNLRTDPAAFLELIAPFRPDVVVGVECIFTWYWLADLCDQENIPFVLGHALYMKAIHGGKAKNDRIDAHKIAALLRGGMLPQAYVYPREMRATRDLLRRRLYLVRKRGLLLAHIQNTNHQYNLPAIPEKLNYPSHRIGFTDRFTDPCLRKSMEVDLVLIAQLERLIRELELYVLRQAREHDADTFLLLRSIDGIGKILALTILYEIQTIDRFERVQDFVSYARLVRCAKESAGKRKGTSGKKIGNVHLKWAFSEAAVLFLRSNPAGQKYLERLTRKHGKGKALSILAHKLGRAAYYVMKRRRTFDLRKFLAA